MRIDILTLFPESFEAIKTSILSRAENKKILEINLINIRDFSKDKHKKTDDTTFGGGAGMLMTCQPVFDAIESVASPNSKIIYMSPRGATFCQKKAQDLSKLEHIIILCGHYEGVDQRIIDYFNIEEISIGDYVLTGGEIPAMVVVDSLARLIPNVIRDESTQDESFSNDLLEYPQYTKPRVFRGMEVPEVLVNGNHKLIDEWRLNQSIAITKERRPDLYEKYIKENKSK